MAPELAGRIRAALGAREGVGEIAMFGGLCFTLNGHMLVGAMRSGNLLVRVGKAREAEALSDPLAKRLAAGSRVMAGYVEVAAQGLSEAALERWIGRAMAEVAPMAPKTKTARRRRGAE